MKFTFLMAVALALATTAAIPQAAAGCTSESSSWGVATVSVHQESNVCAWTWHGDDGTHTWADERESIFVRENATGTGVYAYENARTDEDAYSSGETHVANDRQRQVHVTNGAVGTTQPARGNGSTAARAAATE